MWNQISIMEKASEANGWVNTLDSLLPEVLDKAREIISTNLYCTLSTCSGDGYPWVSPVFFAYDQNWNIYWSSATAAKHSQNLANNQGRVAIAIFKSVIPQGTAQGLYLSGVASELKPDEFERVYKLLEERAGKKFNRTPQDYQGTSPRRIYQFKPHQGWVTGKREPVGNQLVDTKIEISLENL